jgi:hypothetical protein
MRNLLFVLSLLIISPSILACGFEGTATRTDGSKVDGTGGKVSTSWNSKYAYPRNGYYKLNLGSAACGEKVTIYVSGMDMGRYRVPSSGYATFNFTLKGTSDNPVR